MWGTVGIGRRRKRRRLALVTVLAGILLAPRTRLFALDPTLDVSQYAHASWKTGEGFTGGLISSITQTPDGYLWLGTEFGLLRFDGVRAVPWQPPANQHLPSIAVESLLSARDGTLWIGTWKGLTGWKNGKLMQYRELDGMVIMALVEEGDGTVWAAGFASGGTGKLCAIQDGTIHCYGEDGTLGKGPVGLYEDSQGNLWVGVLDGLWRWKPGPAQFYPIRGEPIGIQGLVQGDDGILLISMTGRVARWVEGKIEEAYAYPGVARRCLARTLLRDRDGSLWIGTLGAGLVHVRQGTTDTFAESDGLSSDNVQAIFQDREGNIWVASNTGLDRFRSFTIATFSGKQGFASGTWPILAAINGSIWQGAPDGLRQWNHGQVTIFREPGARAVVRQPATAARVREVTVSGLPNYQYISLSEGDRGRIWIATSGAIGYLQNDRFIPIDTVHASGLAYSLSSDTNGNLWIANWQRGLLHLLNDRLDQQIPWSALGSHDFATALAIDPLKGGVWLGFSKGGLAYFTEGEIRASYAAGDELGEGRVSDLRFDHDGVLWAATEGGLSRLNNGRVATLRSKNGLPCDIVHWSIEDNDRSMWLYTPCGLVRIERAELDAWVSDPNRRIQTNLFDGSDGVSHVGDVPTAGQRVGKSPDGRLWFTTYNGVSVVDPRHLPFNTIPPPVHIEQITADHKAYAPAPDANGNMRLPPRVRDLQIDYTALSLVAPEKVFFRYKLEGWDRDWQDVGTRRQAFYNNLPPRKYRFRVMACNNSGVWNEAGTSVDFSVAPAYYQTIWFRTLCVVAFLGLLVALHRLRLRRLVWQFNIALEARVAERTRIARDLHDTLLQSFQGVVMKLHAVTFMIRNRPAEGEETLEAIVDEAQKAVSEGRDAVQGMRSSTVTTNDLAREISMLGAKLADDNADGHRPEFRVLVEGQSRDLPPILRDDIYRVVSEALRNAFKHAHARRIEVEIHYDQLHLRLRVRDNGKGVDPKVLEARGRVGHYGMAGMHERAELVGGKLTVWSEINSGTEIELKIPARVAYAKSIAARRLMFWKKGA
jgi:signal transduction histidine kinase/ligand-binding sensor domain-containing protein